MITDTFSNILAFIAIIFGIGLGISMIISLFWDYFHFHRK